jgi:hypothetical protein
MLVIIISYYLDSNGTQKKVILPVASVNSCQRESLDFEAIYASVSIFSR